MIVSDRDHLLWFSDVTFSDIVRDRFMVRVRVTVQWSFRKIGTMEQWKRCSKGLVRQRDKTKSPIASMLSHSLQRKGEALISVPRP